MSLVSVIVPCYNSENTIERCVNSILNQTYKKLQVIIINDSSTDNSLKKIKNLKKKDDRIEIINHIKNEGVGIARNSGIKLSKGRYLSFCDSDDEWKFNKIEKQLNFMNSTNQYFCFSDYEIIKNKTKRVRILPDTINRNKLLDANYVGLLTAIYDVSFFGKKYFASIRRRQDWIYWLELFKEINEAYKLNEVLATYHVTDKSLSSNKFRLLKYNFLVFRKFCKMNIFKSFYYLFRFLIFHFFKNKLK
tara:strand:+ start:14053 stop:14796 length:744 start_codon:yes stop_codon:yes gene_type:complete